MPGFFDYAGTEVGIGFATDITEGVTFNVTLYGSTRTYMPTKNFSTNYPISGFIALRYD